MQSDEVQIRQLVADWMKATQEKNPDAVLRLMTDDVKFLVPGRAPFGKAEFEKAARSQATGSAPAYEGKSVVREVCVDDAMAYAISELTVIAIPQDGSPPIERAGHTLTVFRKVDGKWLLARDANLLSAPPKPS